MPRQYPEAAPNPAGLFAAFLAGQTAAPKVDPRPLVARNPTQEPISFVRESRSRHRQEVEWDGYSWDGRMGGQLAGTPFGSPVQGKLDFHLCSLSFFTPH